MVENRYKFKIVTSLKLQFNKHDPENIQLCPGKYSALSGENTGAAVWKTRRLAHNTHFDQIHACKTSKVLIKTQNKDFL